MAFTGRYFKTTRAASDAHYLIVCRRKTSMNTAEQQKRNSLILSPLFGNEITFIVMKTKIEVELYSPKMLLVFLQKNGHVLDGITSPVFSRYLKHNGIVYDHKSHLKQSLYFRNKYALSSTEINANCAKGAKATLNLRKTRKSPYNKKHTISYWLDQAGGDAIKAKVLKKNFARTNNPNCIDFWLKKGYDAKEAKVQISTRSSKAAKIQRKKLRTKKISTETFVETLLRDNEIVFIREFPLKNLIKEDQRINMIYDFFISPNLLVEVQGTYWHADPRVYQKTDMVNGISVYEIWEKDKRKKMNAEVQNYKLITIWETDLLTNQHTKKLIAECLNNIQK
jgi:hypothetical protein